MTKKTVKRKLRPLQSLSRQQQGKSKALRPVPIFEKQKKVNRPEGKVAIITGADSGIGKL